MEPTPYYFNIVNRTALIIKCKKPFYDWLAFMDPDDNEFIDNDNAVYLLPDFEEVSKMENWLKKNFDGIFCDQLNNWYTDENDWPQTRTFKIFKEWFDYSLHTTIMDTQDRAIDKIS